MDSFIRAEIERHDWGGMECGCEQVADHLPKLLQSVADGRRGVVEALDNHVFIQSNLMEPAPAVAAVAMAMLADDLPTSSVGDAVWILWHIAESEGETDSDEVPLFSESIAQIRQGLWSLYRELVRTQDERIKERVLDILRVVESNTERLRFYVSRSGSEEYPLA
ncbi:hypothetical protein ACWGNM_41260 [Streptomyces sp. NPDC055796]